MRPLLALRGLSRQRCCYSTITKPHTASTGSSPSSATTTQDRGPLRIAVLGSGPAGFYTALRAVQKYPNTHVHMYEAQPTPYGLVRYGVAPDHPEVKNCQEKFATLSTHSPSFRFLGNVSIGTDIPLPLLQSAYNAIILSYGASQDRTLGIPGETTLANVVPARDFVGWYNSFPLCANKGPKLSEVEDVVIVGQGNVALDVARVLLSNVDDLRGTDMSEAALEELSRSRVKRVRIVGRRGVCQGAFQIKEVRELMALKNVGFIPPQDLDQLMPSDLSTLPRQQKRLMELMLKGGSAGPVEKTWGMDFCLSPTSFNGDASGRLQSVTFRRNALSPNPFEKDARAVAIEPEETVTMEAQLAFRSIGYKSIPIPSTEQVGLPFNSKNGTIPNQAGRILSSDEEGGKPMPGWYCAGWVKRGPTGVIASTMMDAFDTAETLVSDWVSGKPFLEGEGGWEKVREGMSEEARGKRVVEWEDWRVIEGEERRRGRKISSLEEMLRVVDEAKGRA
ncbi:nucleotide-binding domain-containing protein [Ascobolus immersus RN42]|uniref:NADPH:adrenodoxin oxidoreductase, mitochondrial n=1 Tax=Ascobolus immersus RN42 TaxID=1160509 RepID=A0A3N4I1H4_ASCIM|nr:nucleotide-binding domain-containing protein [Ascobolus immersus RN42]